MSKLTPEKTKLLKDTLNKFPTYTDQRIATKLNVCRKTVLAYRKEVTIRYDSEFVSIVAGKFIAAFGKAGDYWLSQISELEELKSKDMDPMEVLAICKQQADLQVKILFLAGQGEVKEVIRVMRSGKLPSIEAT